MESSAVENQRGPAGVLLLNLGGPEFLKDVRPFLYNLFSDPDIIRIRNEALRKSLAWLVATLRQGRSRALYRQIGGGSPLRRITEGQARALHDRLVDRDCPARTYVGMRCWKPTIDEALNRILRDGIRRLVVLPLFPQYSFTTTGSCINYIRSSPATARLQSEILYVEAWHREPLYIEAVAGSIRKSLAEFPPEEAGQVHLLYSAHSIPERYIAEGDPYLVQTRQTVESVQERLEAGMPHTLAFQSKVGPVKWLGPPTDRVIEELGRRGVRRVLVIPISFVSDHIETLQEIDIAYRELARKSGIRSFHRAPSLNLDPKFIDALADITVRALS